MTKQKQTKKLWLVILIGLVLLSFVSAGAIQDVKNYWIEKGLNNESAERISRGQQTTRDVLLAEALEEQEVIEIELNQTEQQTEEFDWGGLVLIILFCVIPLIAIVTIVTLYVRNTA